MYRAGIRACPSNPTNIPGPPQSPQMRTCSIDIALNGSTGSMDASGATSLDGVVPILKYRGINTPRKSQKVVFVDENEQSVDDGCFLNYPAGSPFPAGSEWAKLPGSRHNQRLHFFICRRPCGVFEVARYRRAHVQRLLPRRKHGSRFGRSASGPELDGSLYP